MKNKLKYLVLMVLPLGAVFLTACAPTGFSRTAFYGAFKVVKKPILIQPKRNQGKLKIQTRGDPGCKHATGRDENGCVVADHGESVLINFELTDASGWTFSQITICKGDSKATQTCKLDVWERREFEAYEDPNKTRYRPESNGVITLPEGLNKVYLLDLNLMDESYFYTIKACHPVYNCLYTDPPIINRGRY